MWWRRRRADQQLSLKDDLLREAQVDADRFLRYSIPPEGGVERLGELTGMQLDALTTRSYHRVEKGFSLPDPRRPFGQRSIPALERAMANPNANTDAIFVEESRRALEALAKWNETGLLDEQVAPRGDSLPTNPLDPADAATFLTSRHSVRDFASTPVDRAIVEEAVRQAGYAPSVCNRQGWRVHYFDAPEDIARILSMHRGSAGFAHAVPGLFIVTYDLRAFEHTLELHQGWIDAGLYSMTLLLALHGLGLGAVPLNWSRRNRGSNELRRRAGIADHENVVMLIAAGHPSEGHRVARSARRPVGEILRFGSTDAQRAEGRD